TSSLLHFFTSSLLHFFKISAVDHGLDRQIGVEGWKSRQILKQPFESLKGERGGEDKPGICGMDNEMDAPSLRHQMCQSA
ncbi:hypothetical protein, partial [Erwinia sp. S43]|uniref:hypothetical protein n=1 Tax=Erwinia sp. S43 TaxID=2769339 RepID=UPI001F3AD997